MIDQNNEIIQELKNRPINENGYIHVARQNNYNDLIESTKKEIYNNKKILKFECYVEWLENEVLYQTFKAQWNENQRRHLENRLLKTEKTKQYLTESLEEIMGISINHGNPNEPYINDWHSVYSIAETIYNKLKGSENDVNGECNDNKYSGLSDEEVERIINQIIYDIKGK